MKRLIDKLPLAVLCCVISTASIGYFAVTASFLIAVCVSVICQLIGKNRISLVVEMSYAVVCFFVPELLYFVPLVLYDVVNDERYYAGAVMAAAFIYSAAERSCDNVPLLLVTSVTAVILCLRTSAYEKLEKKYIVSRDASTEQNILLSDQNSRLVRQQDYEVHYATLKERNRIAREIHDNVGHLLSRSILQVGALQITEKDELRSESLASLSETLNNAMTSIRQSVHNLHDDSVDLEQSVSDAVKPLQEKGLKVKLDMNLSDTTPNNVKLCFISIVKEGVSNIIRHSNADTVSIALIEHPAFYQLMIDDNGSCSDKVSESGIGLANMRDRAEALGGIIRIGCGKNGFRIFLSVKKQG